MKIYVILYKVKKKKNNKKNQKYVNKKNFDSTFYFSTKSSELKILTNKSGLLQNKKFKF